MDALLKEWEARKDEWLGLLEKKGEQLKTIYIGGGTPSTLDISSLQNILNHIILVDSPLYNLEEITMEVNPGDVTEERARAWKAMGINRLSMGIQSFDDGLLQLIGRRHTAEQAKNAVKIVQSAGFDNLSIDLMYGLPGQGMEQWQRDIAKAIGLGVQHISSYGLIYEEGTVLTTLLEQGKIDAVDEDIEMTMYDKLVDELTANGYVHYEVSNFALKGRESKHNSSYWNDTPYLGLGAGAHSYDGNTRWWNEGELDSYIAKINAGKIEAEKEELTAEDRHLERVMLGLRTNKGISIDWIDKAKAQEYIQQGLLCMHDGNVVATTLGFHVLNRIIEDLV